MEAISCITLGLSGPPLWLDVHQLLYATGNGLVAQDLSSGVQVGCLGQSGLTICKPLQAACPTPFFCFAASHLAVWQQGTWRICRVSPVCSLSWAQHCSMVTEWREPIDLHRQHN
jgi:hypothetical protein